MWFEVPLRFALQNPKNSMPLILGFRPYTLNAFQCGALDAKR